MNPFIRITLAIVLMMPTAFAQIVNPGGSGGVSTAGVRHVTFSIAQQAASVGTGFSLPSTNFATFVGSEGASSGDVTTAAGATIFGALSFAKNASDSTAQSVQGTIMLPSTWAASAKTVVVKLSFASSATTGNALWQVQGMCVASGAIPGTFSSPVSFPATAVSGTTNGQVAATVTLTASDALASCSASNPWMFRLWRQGNSGSDTVASAVLLVTDDFAVAQ